MSIEETFEQFVKFVSENCSDKDKFLIVNTLNNFCDDVEIEFHADPHPTKEEDEYSFDEDEDEESDQIPENLDLFSDDIE